MINKHYKKVRSSAPILSLLTEGPYMDKLLIKNIYPQWNGETTQEVADKHDHNPFVLRIGTPIMDEQISNDRVYFISKYISYNPIAKEIENRNLINNRFTKKLFIGQQTVDEASFNEYGLFVNGNVVAKDILILDTRESLMDKIRSLEQQVRYMQGEIAKIAKQTNLQTIYK